MAEEPAFLPVGTDVSAKYRGAFCEAKVKTIKKFVKCKINFIDAPNGVVSDDNVKGILKVGAVVEAKHPEMDNWTKGIIQKLTDASTYTVVFDDGDEKTLRRTSLCLQGERHFNESETLDHLPLTDPENFGTPVMRESHSKKKRRLSTRSQGDDDDDDDSDVEGSSRSSRRDDRDDSIGKVIVVETNDKRKNAWFPALVVDPTTAKDIQPKSRDHVVARSFKDNRYYSVDKQSRRAFAHRDHHYKGDLSSLKTAVEKAVHFVETGQLPSNWDAEILKRIRGASGAKKGKNDGDKGETEEEEEEGSEDESDDDDEYDEEKDAWLASLHKFMEERGTPINKPPVLGFRDLNLYKLYKLVQDLGGCRKVTDKQKWRYVATKMGIPAVTTSQPYNIKAAYNKYLHAFEDYNRKLGPGIARSLPRTRRRSSYGEHWPIPTLPVLTKIEKTPPQSKKSQASDSEEDLSITSPRSKKKVGKKSDPKTDKDTPDKKDVKTKEKDRKEEEKHRKEEEKQKEKQEKEKREKDREKEKREKDREKEKREKDREKEKREKDREKDWEKEKMEKDREKEKREKDREKEKREKDREEEREKEKEKADEERKEKDKKEKEKLAKDKKEKKDDKEKDVEQKPKRPKETEKNVKRRRDSRTVEGSGKKEDETESGNKHEQKSDASPSVKPDFEIGEKIKVQYGRGRMQKIYEAKIVDYEIEGGKVVYTIHYMGWNVRFDEVITADRILGWAEKKRERHQREREKLQKEKELEAERKEKEENERREKERVKREQEKAREKEQKDREKRERDAKEKREREAKEKEEAERKEREEAAKKELESKLKKTEKEQETEKAAEDKAEDKKSKHLGKRGRPSTSKTPTPPAIPTSTPGRSTPPHNRSTSRSPVSDRSYPTRARRSDRRSLTESPFASGLPSKSRPRRSSGYSESVTKSERSWSESENDELEENSSQESEVQIPETKDDESSTTDERKIKTDLDATTSQPQEPPGSLEESPDKKDTEGMKEKDVLAETEETENQDDVKDKLPEIVKEKNDVVERAEIVEDETGKESEEERPPNLTPQKELLAQPEEPSKKKEKKDKKESKKEAKSRSKKEGKVKKDQTRQSSGDAKKEAKGKKDSGKKLSQPKADVKEKEPILLKEEPVKERREPTKEKREAEPQKEMVPIEPEEEGKKRKGRKRRRRKSQEGRSKGEESKEESLAEPQEKKKKDPDQKHTRKAEVTKPEPKQESKEDSVGTENLESIKALSEPSSSCGSGKIPFTYKGRPLLSTPPTSPENSPAAPSSPAAQEPAKGSVHEADDEHVSGKSDSDALIEVASVGESNQVQRRHSPHHDASSSSSSAEIGTAHPPTLTTDTKTVKPDSGDNISPKKRKRNTSESEQMRKRSRKRSRRQSSVASSVAERRRPSTKDVPRNSSSDTDETHSDVKHSHSGHRSEGRDPDRRSSEALSKVSSSSSASKVEGQPVQRKWNFLIDVSHIQDPEERIALIQRQLNDLRKIYMQLKTEVATIDRRRKKFRRKEREAAAAAAALASQKQASEKKSTDST